MGYWISVLTESCIFAVMALGLNVIWGWAGDFDLALYGYVALGVYLTIVMTAGPAQAPTEYILGWHLPYLLAVALSILFMLPIAAAVGAVALRNLREIYFAIATLGVISVIYVVVQVDTPLFNGFNGVYGLQTPMAAPLGISYSSYKYFLLGMCALVLAIVTLVLQMLSKSPYGRAMRSIRDNEQAAAAFGRSVFSAKLIAYVLGAGLAALGGGLFAAYLGAFNPSAWQPAEILTLYAAVLVGGRGNVRGVVAGTFIVYIGFEELTRYLPNIGSRPEFASSLRQVLIGLLIVLMLKFRPQGLFPDHHGISRAARRAARAHRHERGGGQPDAQGDPERSGEGVPT
ncbi:MAG: branched-chain amino acid ABC transporter permease [Solirubrobacteraceae bacterium]